MILADVTADVTGLMIPDPSTLEEEHSKSPVVLLLVGVDTFVVITSTSSKSSGTST